MSHFETHKDQSGHPLQDDSAYDIGDGSAAHSPMVNVERDYREAGGKRDQTYARAVIEACKTNLFTINLNQSKIRPDVV